MRAKKLDAMANTASREQPSIAVIYNPVAGTTDREDFERILAERCAAQGRSYEQCTTGPEDNLAEIARAAYKRGVRRFGAAGGDGTVSAVADGLVATDACIGILPIGTANILARELGVPADLGTAIDMLLATPAERKIDALRIHGRHFLLHVGIGVSSLMHRDTSREAKRRFGRLAYIVNAARLVSGLQPERFTIVVDGRRHRRRASQVIIANGGTLGAKPFRWADSIDPGDGQVDVCVLYAESLLHYLSFAWHALLGRQHRLNHYTIYPARQCISINTRRSMPVQADGEIIGNTPVQIAVVPGAVRFIVPS
jgi:diacylglycerol kinase (ATP)